MTPNELLERYDDLETGKPMERVRVTFADELPGCDCCGEPYCQSHSEHYADCECPGPSEPPGDAFGEGEEWTLEVISETFYWVRPANQPTA